MTGLRVVLMNTRLMRILPWALLLIGITASSAGAKEMTLSLQEVLALIRTGNPEIRAMYQAVLASKEDIGIARSLLLPKITFEERYMRTNNPTYSFMAKLNQSRFEQDDFAVSSLNHPSPVDDFQTGFFFEQPLFVPKAYVAVDMARMEASAKAGDFGRKQEDVAFRAVKTYLGVQTSREFVSVAEKGVEDAKEHLRLAEARYNADLGLYSDVLRARVALSSAEEKLVSARKNLAVAKRALGLTIGLAESVDAQEERPALELRDLEYYSAAALSRKDVKSLETRHRNAENALRMANAGYWPVFGVGGSYQLNSHRAPFADEGDSWQISAFMRWELFDGAKRESERQKAKYMIGETAEYLDGLKKRVLFEVYEAYLGVEEAAKGLDLARSALTAAEEGSRLVKVRYENSLSTIVDLLDVQTGLDKARADVTNKEGVYATAIVNLGFQSGTIQKELGLHD
jgi:outer membrane protein